MSIDKMQGMMDAFKHVIELSDRMKSKSQDKLQEVTLESIKEFCTNSIVVCEETIDGILDDMHRERRGKTDETIN